MSDKYQVVPFRPEHLSHLVSRESLRLSPDARAILRHGYQASLAWTGLVYGNPIACVGILVFDRIGYAWAVLDQEVPRYAVFVHRTVSRFLDALFASLPIRRLQAFVVLPDTVGAGQWLQRLGFQKEGVLRCAGPTHEDFELYARIKN